MLYKISNMLYENLKYVVHAKLSSAVWKFQICFEKISIILYKNFKSIAISNCITVWSTGLPTKNEILMTTLISLKHDYLKVALMVLE